MPRRIKQIAKHDGPVPTTSLKQIPRLGPAQPALAGNGLDTLRGGEGLVEDTIRRINLGRLDSASLVVAHDVTGATPRAAPCL